MHSGKSLFFQNFCGPFYSFLAEMGRIPCYPAHFSQKNNNRGKPQMFGKRLFPLCYARIVPKDAVHLLAQLQEVPLWWGFQESFVKA